VDTSGPTPDDAMTRSEEILREEEPVVEKRVVPRERVRLDKDTVTGEEQVTEELRKEQVEVQDEDGKLGRHERRRRR
jgi:stress response protein YsnF